MPAFITYYTFPKKLKITNRQVSKLVNELRPERYDELLIHFGIDELNSKTIEVVLDDIKNESVASDNRKKRYHLYHLVQTIMESDELREEFQFTELGEKADYKGTGHNDWYYYEFILPEEKIRQVEKELKKLGKELGTIGKTLQYTIS